MADVEQAIVELLMTDPQVAFLLKAPPFQERLAQGAKMPALTYKLISDPSESSHQGPSGLAEARFQFDIWGDTKEQTYALSFAVRKAIAGVHRVHAGVLLSGGRKESEMSNFDAEVGKRRRTLDMLVWHSED